MDKTMMFDFDKYYDKVAEQLPDNSICVEVGIANAESIIYLAKKLKSLGKKFTLYGVDDMSYGSYNQMNDIFRNIYNAGVFDCITVIPKDSIEASKDFNDNSLDFVFLDSSHLYEPTKQEIMAWYPKLKDGCLLAGHDFFGHDEVNRAVREMIPEKIKRETINKPDQYQEFDEEVFLRTYQTTEKFGVWECVKNFYWQPKL